MKLVNKKSIHDDLKKYCVLAKDNDHIEVTEWTNGEGWDIIINDKIISLTWGELDAINYLTKALAYEKKNKTKKR